eukprot:407073_1
MNKQLLSFVIFVWLAIILSQGNVASSKVPSPSRNIPRKRQSGFIAVAETTICGPPRKKQRFNAPQAVVGPYRSSAEYRHLANLTTGLSDSDFDPHAEFSGSDLVLNSDTDDSTEEYHFEKFNAQNVEKLTEINPRTPPTGNITHVAQYFPVLQELQTATNPQGPHISQVARTNSHDSSQLPNLEIDDYHDHSYPTYESTVPEIPDSIEPTYESTVPENEYTISDAAQTSVPSQTPMYSEMPTTLKSLLEQKCVLFMIIFKLTYQNQPTVITSFIEIMTKYSGGTQMRSSKTDLEKKCELFMNVFKSSYQNQPDVMKSFIGIMAKYYGRTMSVSDVAENVKTLLVGQPELFQAFQQFVLSTNDHQKYGNGCIPKS